MKLSLIIPIYNESQNINQLYQAILSMTKQLNENIEIIMIDDGSKDDSLIHIEQLAARDERLTYISFSRNFGKESAMLAGLKTCTGDAAIIMDSDLQHPPDLIPQMIEGYYEGYDQVVAKRNRDGEAFYRKWPTQFFYSIINNAVDVKLTDGEGDFRLISRPVINALLSLNEINRFSKGMFGWVGYNKKVILMKNVERNAGRSSFSPKKLLNYAIDGIISYNNQPLRACFYFGSFVTLLSLIYISYTFIDVLMHGIEAPGYFTTISAVLFLGGVQLLCLGVIGEYIGKIYYEVKKRPHYIIESTNKDDDHEKN